ncbi:hypothetical protein Q8A67_005654 [Cirrhinus molitorella]|uniref:Ig-like domain-containing protein n=1 Tax=Cirrhinus molitorella TaxID=172907 RepID=A0AA88TTY3_9TELE|nr:hypothetical protein Q8A67_005654 [Cirrhinus molitorella]
MKTTFRLFQILLLMCGLFGKDEKKTESLSVTEGESVTLNPDPTKIKDFFQLLWWFGENGPRIAQIDGSTISYDDEEIFRNRLLLNPTGSLTIKNIRTKHSQLYKLQIENSEGQSFMSFSVTVQESPVIDASFAETKSVSLNEGDSGTLQTDITKLDGDELIVWRFGDEGKLIYKSDIEAKSPTLYDNDEIFRDRLQLNDQTGSLTIKNMKNADSGHYRVKISSSKQIINKKFIVTVSVITGKGLSPASVAGIVVGFLLAFAAAAAMGFVYYHRKISELRKMFVSVEEGDYFILKPDAEIQRGEDIQWMFGDKDLLIAEIKGNDRQTNRYYDPDEIFKGKQELDNKTGSLTITNISTEHAGDYKLKIRGRFKWASYKTFSVKVNAKPVTVTVGYSVTLKTDLGEIQENNQILWYCEDYDHPIAKIKGGTGETPTYDDGPGGIFRNKLKLNKRTGDLTITNTIIEHDKLYKLQISTDNGITSKRFRVTVKEKPVTVTVGDSVTLNTDLGEIQENNQILWYCEDHDLPIAKIKGGTGETPTYDDGPGGIFRNKLKLDKRTGDLTIKNTTDEHDKLYKLQISTDNGITSKRFWVTVKVKTVPVIEGDSVTLNTDLHEIQKNSQILWSFGYRDSPIAKIKGRTGETPTYDDGPDRIFKDQLKLNKETGDLTITNTTAKHGGLYKLQIRTDNGITSKRFWVTVKVKTVTVIEGDPVTLKTDLPEIQENNQILWYCKGHDLPIAKIKAGTGETPTYDDGPWGIFKNTLELDKKTGDLTIKNTTDEHIGQYKLQISTDNGITSKRFRVTVKENPVPVIEGKSSTLNTGLTEIQISTGKGPTSKRLNVFAEENQVNESVTVNMPLLEYPDGANDQEAMSSL